MATRMLVGFIRIIVVCRSGQGVGGDLDVAWEYLLSSAPGALCAFQLASLASTFGPTPVWSATPNLAHIFTWRLVRLALEAVTGAPDIALYVFIAAAVILTATQSSASQMLFRNPVSHFLGNGFIFALPYTLAAITIFVKLGAIPYTEDRLPGRIFLSAADLFGLLGSMRLGELLTLQSQEAFGKDRTPSGSANRRIVRRCVSTDRY